MKKTICIVLVLFVSLIAVANAETDVSSMINEELYSLRLQINQELASRIEQQTIPEGATIAELFPDTYLARHIRDSIGAFSTSDKATQEKLDSIKNLSFDRNDDVGSLEGIQYLHNLESLNCFGQNNLLEIPDTIGNLKNLKRIDIYESPITMLPDSICNLLNLTHISIERTNVISLPDDIGNLTSLEYLNISYTKITELPDSIYTLELKWFYRNGLDLD